MLINFQMTFMIYNKYFANGLVINCDRVESCMELKWFLQSSHGYLSEVKHIETSLLQILQHDGVEPCRTMMNLERGES